MHTPDLPTADIPDYADLMPLEEWKEALGFGMFVPNDGTGYYATATKMNPMADAFAEPPAWATHVAWFNK